MRTLRIRKFMIIGMISVVMFPWFIYFSIHFHNSPQPKRNETINRIAANSANWSNPIWQKKIRKQLSHEKLNAVILSPTNHEIFRVGYWREAPWMSNQQVTVMENGRIVGTVKVSTRWQNDTLASLSALTALVLAIFFVGFQMRRSVVKPLEAMSKAARRIGEGDFEIKVPVSRVTEIEQVRTGFKVMVAGLKESFQKQARLEEERRFFIGAIAHDLRTPLFALRGYLDGLEQGIANTPEKIAKYVEVCKEKSQQLDRLVSDLFAFSKLEYMEQTPQLEKVDLGLIVKSSIDSLRPLAVDKNISISLESDQCEITADSHLLERAMNNLLDNALRHSPVGGDIFVVIGKEPKKITVSVRDTGPGFTPEDLKHVFDPLYRGEVSRNRETGGAGLGLTIAKRIFKSHGGNLMAENGPNGGAVLTGWISVI